jgi:hypothetical protein
MKRVLLLGYGNPLRGDDGIGWRVTEAYEQPSRCKTRFVRGNATQPAAVAGACGVDHELRSGLVFDAAAEAEAGVVRRRECAPAQSRTTAVSPTTSPPMACSPWRGMRTAVSPVPFSSPSPPTPFRTAKTISPPVLARRNSARFGADYGLRFGRVQEKLTLVHRGWRSGSVPVWLLARARRGYRKEAEEPQRSLEAAL